MHRSPGRLTSHRRATTVPQPCMPDRVRRDVRSGRPEGTSVPEHAHPPEHAAPDTRNHDDSSPVGEMPTPTRGHALAPDEGVPDRGSRGQVLQSLDGRQPRAVPHDRRRAGPAAPPARQGGRDDRRPRRHDAGRVRRRHVDRWSRDDVLPAAWAHPHLQVRDGPATILFIVTPGHLDEFFRLKGHASTPAEVAELARRFF